ncbi:lysine-sensitive aspartokinase 3 [Spirochaeta isovalerica]|uniref:Aspartokinase n=1 Tax=Spirochaeta isovalerica TaxID=150 RepID=A0A841RBD6_9SPIO|nr:lysine-sensitive aspartokinase 3 [Spirochaeta isovalerica]MBB6481016.1 aspartate kinase [Spirochaeta isovalerica]
MIVLKFGGTSVENAERIDRILDIAEAQLDRAPVLVSSAMGKTTNKIEEIIVHAVEGDSEEAYRLTGEISDHHLNTAKEFLTGGNLESTYAAVSELMSQFSSLVKGLSLLHECSPRSRDALLSFGELLSTRLIAARALERGINTELLDSRDFVITDENFNSARPIGALTEKAVRDRVFPEPLKLIIAQGFISSTEKGVTTTLGRGGSDYSATIIGSALSAQEVQIWTDVDGIMTSDPRFVKGAKTIDSITYSEAGELAFFGAKVVHPATIQPAVKQQIPVLVKNSHNPQAPGTAILPAVNDKGVKAITGKREITVVSISSSNMLNAYGFLKNIFTIFDRYKTSVDLISTSEVSVSMTIENAESVEGIVKELEEMGTVTVESNKSIICLVGQELWKDSVFVSRVFGSLNGTPIRMISLGASDTNLSIVVPEEKLIGTIQSLHDEFFS